MQYMKIPQQTYLFYPPDTAKQYVSGYEEGRIENLEKWLIEYDKQKRAIYSN